MAASADNMLLGAGIVYFDRLDREGLYTGERDLGHLSAFSLTTTVEKITKYSNRQAARRKYKEVIKQIDATAKGTMDEFDTANLAIALYGEESVIKQVAKADASTKFTAFVDRWYKLDGRDVESVEVKSGGASGSAEVIHKVDEDYEVEAETGRIYIVPSGAIKDKTEITVTYALTEKTYVVVNGASVGDIRGRLRFIGDPSSGKRFEAEFWNVSVSPDGDLNLIGADEFASIGLTFSIEDDSKNHKEFPLYRVIEF